MRNGRGTIFGKTAGALLLAASLAWSALSLEVVPNQPEQGEEFTFSLVISPRDLPADYKQPELQFDETALQLLSSSQQDEDRRDFFSGRYRVKRFAYRMKGLKEGTHTVAIFWEFDGERRSVGNGKVTVRRSLDAAGMTAAAWANRKTVWEGEQFLYTVQLKAYPNFRQDQGSATVDFGSGFWGGFREGGQGWERAERGAAPVVATRTLLADLVAMKPGEQTIPPFRVKYLKEGRPERKVEEKQTPFGMTRFESVTQEPQEATATAGAVTLTVKPLPAEGRPHHFSGLVGSYTLTSQINTDTTDVGAPITLEIRVSGDGRPGATPKLQLPDLREFRTVPPEESTTQTVRNGKQQTTWTGKWFLYPRRPGTFAIEPVRFSYFDPQKGEYRTAETSPLTLRVGRSAGGGNDLVPPLPSPGTPGGGQREITALGSDIKYILTDGEGLRDEMVWPHRRIGFWLLLLLLLSLPASVAGGRALWLRTAKDPERMQRNRARAAARWRLKSAREAATAQDDRLFYDSLERALLEAVGELLGSEARGWSRNALADRLIGRGLPPESITSLKHLLDLCDRARFAAPAAAEQQYEQLLEEGEELLSQIRRVSR